MSEVHAPGPGTTRHYIHEHEDLRAENPANGAVPTWNESTQTFDFAAPGFVAPEEPAEVTGAREGGKPAVLLTALEAAGIITDATTAT